MVSIITVNYNNTEVTLELLRSCRELLYPSVEIIVVDNNSVESPAPRITAEFPEVTVIESPENLGFAGGNNLGVDAAKGDYFLFINNDAEVTPDLIQPLVDVFNTHADAGAASPKFRYFFHQDTIEYAGYESVSKFTGRNKMIGCGEKDQGQYDQFSQTNYTHGGGMMVSRKAYEAVGPMPEIFFLYYEEFDWCEHMKRAGYAIYYQPDALIYHKESMTTGKNSTLKTYYINRNRILFMRRNRSWLEITPFILYMTLVSVPKNTISFLFRGEFEHLKVYWNAIFWNLNHPKCAE